MPGCGPTSEPAHGTPAGRTSELAKKFLLRDHAPPQSQAASALVAKKGCADGARVRPRHAVIWRPRPGAAWPAASPPANAAPTAGIRDLGSNADSNAAAGTCVHSLCAGRRASVVVGNGSLAYHDDGPREHVPKGQPGGNALTFSSGAYRNREANLYFRARIRQAKKRLAKGGAKATTRRREPDNQGNSLRKASPRRQLKKTQSAWRSPNAHNWRFFPPGINLALKSARRP